MPREKEERPCCWRTFGKVRKRRMNTKLCETDTLENHIVALGGRLILRKHPSIHVFLFISSFLYFFSVCCCYFFSARCCCCCCWCSCCCFFFS